VLNSFQYLETGVLLAVTPRINSGGMVTLDDQPGGERPPMPPIPTWNPNPNVATRIREDGRGGRVRRGRRPGRPDSREQRPPAPPACRCFRRSRARRHLRHQTLSLGRAPSWWMVVTPKIVSDVAQAREVNRTSAAQERAALYPNAASARPKTPVPFIPSSTDAIYVPGA
jgi:general secretion pathway protein D